MSSKNIANFVIAGVNKAGTTSLFSYLSHHPDVCSSSVKETCYFLPIRYQEEMANISEYERMFSHYTNQKIVMEATPGYFYGGDELAARMKVTLGDPSVLIILRDPVERFISFFKFMKNSLLIPANMSLKDYFTACERQTPDMLRRRENNPFFGLEGGCYSRYLPAWQRIFRSKLKVVFFDELRKEPNIFLQEIARFLCIDESYFGNFEFDIENKSVDFKNRFIHALVLKLNRAMEKAFRKSPRFKSILRSIYYQLNGSNVGQAIDSETIEALRLHYRPYNDQLRSLLARGGTTRLPPWLTVMD